MGEVELEGGTIAIPFLWLSQAASVVDDEGTLTLLVMHATTEVLADHPRTWPGHAALWNIVCRSDAASVMLASLDKRPPC